MKKYKLKLVPTKQGAFVRRRIDKTRARAEFVGMLYLFGMIALTALVCFPLIKSTRYGGGLTTFYKVLLAFDYSNMSSFVTLITAALYAFMIVVLLINILRALTHLKYLFKNKVSRVYGLNSNISAMEALGEIYSSSLVTVTFVHFLCYIGCFDAQLVPMAYVVAGLGVALHILCGFWGGKVSAFYIDDEEGVREVKRPYGRIIPLVRNILQIASVAAIGFLIITQCKSVGGFTHFVSGIVRAVKAGQLSLVIENIPGFIPMLAEMGMILCLFAMMNYAFGTFEYSIEGEYSFDGVKGVSSKGFKAGALLTVIFAAAAVLYRLMFREVIGFSVGESGGYTPDTLSPWFDTKTIIIAIIAIAVFLFDVMVRWQWTKAAKEEQKIAMLEVRPAVPRVEIKMPAIKPTPVNVPVNVTVPKAAPIKLPDITVNVPKAAPIHLPDITVNVPKAAPIQLPDINVTVPKQDPTPIAVHIPKQEPIKLPDITVNVPKQNATPIAVHIPKQEPVKLPDINVTVPKQTTPIQVNVPKMQTPAMPPITVTVPKQTTPIQVNVPKMQTPAMPPITVTVPKQSAPIQVNVPKQKAAVAQQGTNDFELYVAPGTGKTGKVAAKQEKEQTPVQVYLPKQKEKAPIIVNIPKQNETKANTPIIVNVPKQGEVQESQAIVVNVPKQGDQKGSTPIVVNVPKQGNQKGSTPIVVNVPKQGDQKGTAPIQVNVPKQGKGKEGAPIIVNVPKQGETAATAPIVINMPQQGQQSAQAPVNIYMPNQSASEQSVVMVPTSEGKGKRQMKKGQPVVVTTGAKGKDQAAPVNIYVPNTNGKATPVAVSAPANAQPIHITMPKQETAPVQVNVVPPKAENNNELEDLKRRLAQLEGREQARQEAARQRAAAKQEEAKKTADKPSDEVKELKAKVAQLEERENARQEAARQRAAAKAAQTEALPSETSVLQERIAKLEQQAARPTYVPQPIVQPVMIQQPPMQQQPVAMQQAAPSMENIPVAEPIAPIQPQTQSQPTPIIIPPQQPAVIAPVIAPVPVPEKEEKAEEPVIPQVPRDWEIKCPNCGKHLKINDRSTYHRCPACSKVFQSATKSVGYPTLSGMDENAKGPATMKNGLPEGLPPQSTGLPEGLPPQSESGAPAQNE